MTAVLSGRASLVRLCLVALFAALISAGAVVSVPLPGGVPITIQNLFAVLSGLVLGPLFGPLAVGLYLFAGAIGAPVFSGAAGGFVHFAAPSGGYLWGYALAAALAGLVAGSPKNGARTSLFRVIAAAFLGFLVVYIPGVIQLKVILGKGWGAAIAAGFFPFIIGDLIKLVAVSLAAPRLRSVVGRIFASA